MAVTPNIMNGSELSELDLFYIGLWERHIDFMLATIRDWDSESELYEPLVSGAAERKSEREEFNTDALFIHAVPLNELTLGLYQVRKKYEENRAKAGDKIFLALYRLIPLNNGSEMTWSPFYAPEIIKRYKEAGWKNVEHMICTAPPALPQEEFPVQYVLVFTPPGKMQRGADCDHETVKSGFNQKPRAVSLRAGWVYLLKAENGLYKIGRSRNPNIRIPAITKAVAPFEIKEVHKAFYEDCVKVERQFHLRFKDKRGPGEWFALTPEEVKIIIEHQHEPL